MGDDLIHFYSIIWLLMIALVVALFARRIKIPYTIALVLAGLALGAGRWLPQLRLNPTHLVTILLPPLLFESAINLSWKNLKRDGFPIVCLTFIGIAASAGIIGLLTSLLFPIPFLGALVFGALISATDPIAVIAIFRNLGTDKRLTLLLDSESLFNDAVAVCLFTTLISLADGGSFSFMTMCWKLIWLLGGGAAVGALIGWLSSRLHSEVDDHLIEITITSAVVYGSYLIGEALHVSGVTAVVAAGLVVGTDAMRRSINAETRAAITDFWEYAAFLSNSIVFLLVGIEIGYVRQWETPLLLLLPVIALLGRAVVYPTVWVINRMGARIPSKWSHIMVWGGLRGALSMALAISLKSDFPHRGLIVQATFIVVVFTLLVQGASLSALLRKLKITPETA